MVDVAQLVEPWIVIPVVVGSSPIVHPNFQILPMRVASDFTLERHRTVWSNTVLWAVSSIGRAVDS